MALAVTSLLPEATRVSDHLVEAAARITRLFLVFLATGQGTHDFTTNDKANAVCLFTSSSDSRTFWEVLILHMFHHTQCIFISHRHNSLLKELHLLDDSHHVGHLLMVAILRGHVDQVFNRPIHFLLVCELLGHFFTEDIACH